MIYIITHKSFQYYFNDSQHYEVLHVGKNENCRGEYLRDDIGDNISEKNPNFCELTGLYWIWKNGEESAEDITGLVHYRRYFTDRISDIMYTYFGVKPHVISYKVIQNILKKKDIILPVREKIFRTVEQSYVAVHNKEDLELTRKAIEKVTPEYVNSFDQVMNSHYYYYANMMICRKKLLDEYSQWLFAVIDELENLIDINKYEDNYQKRVFGFLSERLLQVWVIKNKLNVHELPIFNIEQKRVNLFEKNYSRFKNLIKKLNQ